MSGFEHISAEREARRATPGRPWTPREEPRQEALGRYLAAVAAAASAKGAEESAPAASPSAAPAGPRPSEEEQKTLLVRDVMQVPAVSVPGDMPFVEVARTLTREQVSAVPVVDSDDHVIGVVSESDLLAKAAVMAEPHRHGPVGRLRQHRLYDKGHGDTAATLMTFPPVTVHPAERVADAAWTAAHARLKRLPVTDHRGRLAGVVSRRDLLRALVREDAEIQTDVESMISRYLADPGAVRATVENGVVTVTGTMDRAVASELLASVGDLDDVLQVVDDTVTA
ncbi:CBS domain-containing protein [Streptomyces sp. NPDC086080]|uniref:CBS domain-containing protein n=1 Tax=Streptomyces sp. NPDC086080 TaxID=3365748 RepID=UPI0037D406CA